MGIFLLPRSNIDKLNSLLKTFWWGVNGDTSKIHWVHWDKMGLAKRDGGLWFRDMHSFNLTLLSK